MALISFYQAKSPLATPSIRKSAKRRALDYDRAAVVWNERFQTLIDALNESNDETPPIPRTPFHSNQHHEIDNVRPHFLSLYDCI